MREFAGIWRDMPKLVFSRTLERADWNATVVRDVVADDVQKLKAQPGGDLSLAAPTSPRRSCDTISSTSSVSTSTRSCSDGASRSSEPRTPR